MKRFSDREDYEEGVSGFEELVGHTIIIHSVDFYKGDFGEYAVVEFNFESDETRRAAQTGAKQIVNELHKVSENEDLPILGEVFKVGRALRIG